MRARPGEHNESDLGTKMVDFEANDLAFERNTLSATNGFGALGWWQGPSPRLSEAGKDCRVSIWNVRNICETSDWFWMCVGVVIAILTVLSGGLFANPILDDSGRQKETDKTAAWRRPMKNELEHREKVFQIQTAWNL